MSQLASKPPILLAALALVSASACTTDSPGVEGEESQGATTQMEGEEGEPWEPTPARGDIQISSVVINQAVDIPITVLGEWVGPAERNSYIIGNRDSLLRIFWEIPEDWQAREIEARLELYYPEGERVEKSQVLMVDGPSFAGDLNRGFWFALIAEEFPPGLEYHVSLWEAGPGAEAERESTTIIESPLGGPELIGIQPETMQLKVELVPVNYQIPGCSTNTADYDLVSEEHEQTFLDYHHEQYPVQEVLMNYRRDAPIQWETELTSLAELWQPLRDMRAAENAAPNVYYYALVDACTNGIDGAGGIAPGLATDLKTAAFERVSSGLWLGGDNYSYHTMVHELGHNHGRAHVFCAGGDAAGTDPSYPHDDGQIGVWGFGIRQFRLHSPTGTRDFMTYCSPNWVSDWGWSKAFLRVRTLTSWDFEGAPNAGEAQQGEVLIGLLLKDGREQWYTSPGAQSPEFYSSGEKIRFRYGPDAIDMPANVQLLDDGTKMITAAVPSHAGNFEATHLDLQGSARAVELTPLTPQPWHQTLGL